LKDKTRGPGGFEGCHMRVLSQPLLLKLQINPARPRSGATGGKQERRRANTG
jgi:hypothetical protein